MSTVSAFEAKTRFGELLERVSKGEEIVITRHDKPVARLVPEGTPRLEDIRRAVTGLRELQQRIHQRSSAKLSDREVRSAIAEGTVVEVPALWPLEVANALTVLVRRRKLTENERQTCSPVGAPWPPSGRSSPACTSRIAASS